MKAYGIPRTIEAEYPDSTDAAHYGSKGCRLRNKKQARRTWKKMERRNGNNQIKKEMNQ